MVETTPRELKMLLDQEKAKYASSCAQQTNLEHDLAAREAEFNEQTKVLNETKAALKKLQSQADEDAQGYVQAQSKYIDQINSLNTDLMSLKKRLTATEHKNEELTCHIEGINEARLINPGPDLQRKNRKVSDQDGSVLANPPEHLGNIKNHKDYVINELQIRIQGLKDEISELKQINERQRAENEQYQVLLVEKTVEGEFANDGNATNFEDMQFIDIEDEELKKKVNDQSFEIRSLENYNTALKATLESLVSRLVNDPKLVKTLNNSKVEEFRQRMESQNGAPFSLSNISTTGRFNPHLIQNMMLPKVRPIYEGNENHNNKHGNLQSLNSRQVSMGVDVYPQAVPKATLPLEVASKNHHRTNSQTSISSLNGERVDSITGIRKLRITGK